MSKFKHKYQKFKRARIPPRFRLTKKDREILEELASYRVLDTKQISLLHPEMAERTIRRRLLYLFQNGFIDRPIHQFSHQYREFSHIIYALGREGAKLVFSDRRVRINWTEKNRQIKTTFLRHNLMVSNFRVALTLALRKTAKSKLLNWEEEEIKQVLFHEGERLFLNPDAFFTIEDRGEYLHYFLEADCSTMRHKRFLAKMRAYWQWWKEGGHKEKFNITKFRVLTITLTPARKENLRRLTKQADDRQQGSEMFLFACETDYNLEKPKSILKPIWQSPRDDKYHHLLE
ncbi:replication-relaxation family protein [bacterium]|nr:replication-relaxation family protein [bacterium]